jgi:glycosyltransferase involved in cell wall biosynthesis
VSRPLVTIICLCYNHERFVIEALESVLTQTYPNVELIVVDDASQDHSKRLIDSFVKDHPDVRFISHKSNQGTCKAFNSAFVHARGAFIIDLAGDDVLLPGRVEAGVQAFSVCDETVGVQFGDAFNIDEDGKPLGLHSDRYPTSSIPQGDVYIDLIRRFFVCGTSVMIRKKVLDKMSGYDESLQYEDFDLWIRSSRHFKYLYLPAPLVKRRIVRGGLHEKQLRAGRDSHAWSTLAVCRKILGLNRTKEEQSALQTRLNYEIRQSVLRGDLKLALQYLTLWWENRSWKPR